MATAAQRGIDVELFIGEQGDQFMVHHAQAPTMLRFSLLA
jgi:cardiolipin synthase A/B